MLDVWSEHVDCHDDVGGVWIRMRSAAEFFLSLMTSFHASSLQHAWGTVIGRL